MDFRSTRRKKKNKVVTNVGKGFSAINIDHDMICDDMDDEVSTPTQSAAIPKRKMLTTPDRCLGIEHGSVSQMSCGSTSQVMRNFREPILHTAMNQA